MTLRQYLQGLLFKWAIFHKGIRFYKTGMIPKNPEFKSAQFETIEGHSIEFYFYREVCEDLIFRRGRIRREKFVGYVIQAQFDEKLPEKLHAFNNLKFFFNTKDFFFRDEQVVVRNLLSIYLDFLRTEIKST